MYMISFISQKVRKDSELVFLLCSVSLSSRGERRTCFCCDNCRVPEDSISPACRAPLAGGLAVSSKRSTFILTLLEEFD